MVEAKDDSPPEKIRRFNKTEDELLPLKIAGHVVRRYKEMVPEIKDEIKDEIESITSEATMAKEDPTSDKSELNVQQLLQKQKKLLNEAKVEIAQAARLLLRDPQENINKLRELYRLSSGEGLDELVQETVQRLAIASMAEVFVDLIPGYKIRPLTAEEEKQKMKSETKKIINFEKTLLDNYQKYLALLEENAKKLTKWEKEKADSSITNMELTKSEKADSSITKMGILSTRCLCKLLNKASHFNFAVNIVGCLVHFTTIQNETLVTEVCEALSQTFSQDLALEISLQGAKAIADLVNIKKGYVSPQLVATLISLRIKEIDSNNKESEKAQIKNTGRLSKNMKKELKRKRKIENPLKEAEAAERLSTKLKLATETMKHVFMTYFRILKRMPNTALLGPVLEGLAKFAHMINVEFFEDLVSSLSEIVDQKHLKVADSLHCIKTVCVIISNEGQVLNIDPLKFYNTLYTIIPCLPFQEASSLNFQINLLIDCLIRLLIWRRRLIPLKRVAAFVKRVLLISILLPTKFTVALLACVRQIFVNHPGLNILVASEDDEETVANGIFQPDSMDPDCSNSICTDLLPELNLLAKHPSQVICAFAKNILNRVPSSGQFRLNPLWANVQPNAWLDPEMEHELVKANADSPFLAKISKFCEQKKISICSKNVCSTICQYLTENPK